MRCRESVVAAYSNSAKSFRRTKQQQQHLLIGLIRLLILNDTNDDDDVNGDFRHKQRYRRVVVQFTHAYIKCQLKNC